MFKISDLFFLSSQQLKSKIYLIDSINREKQKIIPLEKLEAENVLFFSQSP